jgi:hypothetical protein
MLKLIACETVSYQSAMDYQMPFHQHEPSKVQWGKVKVRETRR